MPKPKRINPMSGEDFAALCASSPARDVQAALEDGAEWDSRAFISAVQSNTDANVIWVLLRQARKDEVNLLGAVSKGDRQTALHWAAAHNDNPDVARTLVAAGANLNARDAYGQTPLQKAESVHRIGWKENRR